ETQAHAFAGNEEGRPIVLRPVPIDEESIRRPRDVGDVGRVHTHRGPFASVAEGLVPSGEQARDGLALEIEYACLLLQPIVDGMRMHEAVIGEHDRILAIEADRVVARRLDDDGSVMALLFLEAGMAVIPVGSGLPDRKLVDEGLPRTDA